MRRKYGSIDSFDKKNRKKADHFDFLKRIHSLCLDGVIFPNFGEMVESLTIQFVNYFVISDDIREWGESDLKRLIPKEIPLHKNSISIQLDSTLDVFARVMQKERASKQGWRYGHPVLDMARELNSVATRIKLPRICN
jgi:hypothetical protein